MNVYKFEWDTFNRLPYKIVKINTVDIHRNCVLSDIVISGAYVTEDGNYRYVDLDYDGFNEGTMLWVISPIREIIRKNTIDNILT